MNDKKVDQVYDYFNDNLDEHEKEEIEKELNSSSESNETLDSINILHDTLPYINKEVEPPTGMKRRILDSVINEEHENQQDKTNDFNKDATSFHKNNSQNLNESKQYKENNIKTKQSDYKQIKRTPGKKLSIGIMAALLLLSLIGKGVQYFNHKESKKQSSPMINTNDTHAINLKSMNDEKTQGQAYVSNGKTNNKLMVEANDIEATKGNEVYQVWIIKNDKPYPAGTFSTTNNKGMVVFNLNEINVDKNDTIAITLEPSPNNQEPKGQMVMASKEV
ncbi:anti-sigma factor [Staphylococcus xylosus]|uniref:Anti-sigma factor n=1 Tax=Staphylococcus xylosus TaxID=1288 RepID=A0A418IRI9_STAXY|nr:anti-sigma factor [Staphylococcus xylosus]RIN12471.1 anti-sigma factor [Staphylococcus xylosus]